MNSAVSWTSMGLAKAPSAFCTCSYGFYWSQGVCCLMRHARQHCSGGLVFRTEITDAAEYGLQTSMHGSRYTRNISSTMQARASTCLQHASLPYVRGGAHRQAFVAGRAGSLLGLQPLLGGSASKPLYGSGAGGGTCLVSSTPRLLPGRRQNSRAVCRARKPAACVASVPFRSAQRGLPRLQYRFHLALPQSIVLALKGRALARCDVTCVAQLHSNGQAHSMAARQLQQPVWADFHTAGVLPCTSHWVRCVRLLITQQWVLTALSHTRHKCVPLEKQLWTCPRAEGEVQDARLTEALLLLQAPGAV